MLNRMIVMTALALASCVADGGGARALQDWQPREEPVTDHTHGGLWIDADCDPDYPLTEDRPCNIACANTGLVAPYPEGYGTCEYGGWCWCPDIEAVPWCEIVVDGDDHEDKSVHCVGPYATRCVSAGYMLAEEHEACAAD